MSALGGLAAGCDLSDQSPKVALVIEAPQAGAEVPGLWRPRGLAVDGTGRLYVAEAASGRVRALDAGASALAVVYDAARWEGEGVEVSGPSLTWGMALALVEEQTLLHHTPGQRPMLLSTAGEVAPTPLGRPPGQGEPPAPGARLGDLDLSTLSGLDTLSGPGSDLVLGLSQRIWRAARAPGQPLSEARLVLLAGDGTAGEPPPVAEDAAQAPAALPAWSGLTAHPSGGLFWVDATKALRYRSPSGRMLRVTGHGSLRGGDAQGLALDEFGLLPAIVNLLRWHPTDDALYLIDSAHVLRVTLDLDADGEPRSVPPEGRVVRAAFRALETNGFVISPDGALNVTLGFSGSLAQIARDGSGAYTARYGLHPVDADSGQLNTDRYNLNPNEPYTSRHAPFALRAPLRAQALALWGTDLIMSAPGARGLLSSPQLQVRASGQWPTQELLYNPRSEAHGWPFLAYDPTRPERLYTCDLYAVQAWALSNDGLLGLTVFSLIRPPADGVPGPALDARLTEPGPLRQADRLTALYQPQRSRLLGLDPAGHLSALTGPGRAPLSPAGTVGAQSLDLQGLTAWDIAPNDAARAFALPAPAKWPDAAAGDLILALAATADPIDALGAPLAPRLANHIAGGGGLPPQDDIPARAAALTGVTALHLRVASAASPPSVGLAFALAPPSTNTSPATSQIAYLTPPAPDAPDAGPRLRLLPPSACGDAPPDLSALYALDPLPDLLPDPADGLDPWRPRALVAWSPVTQTLYGCATEAGWRLGEQPLPLNAWGSLGAASLAPAFAPLATPPALLVTASPDAVTLRAVAAPDTPPPARAAQTFAADDLPRWRAVSVAPNGASLSALAPDPDAADRYLLLSGDLRGDALVMRRVAGGGLALGDGARVQDLNPGEVLSGLTVAPDGSLYVALRDTQTLWHLPTARLDTPGADDRARLLAVGAPLFTASRPGLLPGQAVSADLTPLAASGAGVFFAQGGRVTHVARATGAQEVAAEGLSDVQGLATLGDDLYILTRDGLYLRSADGALTPLHGPDGTLTLDDGRVIRVRGAFYGQPPMVATPSGLLLLHPPTHGVVRVSLPLLGGGSP